MSVHLPTSGSSILGVKHRCNRQDPRSFLSGIDACFYEDGSLLRTSMSRGRLGSTGIGDLADALLLDTITMFSGPASIQRSTIRHIDAARAHDCVASFRRPGFMAFCSACSSKLSSCSSRWTGLIALLPQIVEASGGQGRHDDVYPASDCSVTVSRFISRMFHI